MSYYKIIFAIFSLLFKLSNQQLCPTSQCSFFNSTSQTNQCRSPSSSECISSNYCIDYSQTNFVGRDSVSQTCLKNKEASVSNSAQCWYTIFHQICLNSSQNQCVDYLAETDPTSPYVGLMKSSDQTKGLYLCAEINKYVASINAQILKPLYCIDSNTQIVNSILAQNTYAGIDPSSYYCLQVNQNSTATPYCKPGYCVLNSTCAQLSLSFPAKLQNGQCNQLGVITSIECFKDNPFTNKSICLDQYNNICSKITDFSFYNIGIQPNGTCVQQQKVYDQIYLCSDQSCLLKNGTGFSCIPFDSVYIGIDQQGNCLQRAEPQAVRCKKGKYCIEQINYSCMDLSSTLSDLRIARETYTSNCLPYSDFDGQNIDICADGYCLYTEYPQYSYSDYCIQYGNTFQFYQQPFIGVESITERCLFADQLVNSILLCYGPQYCILNINNQQTCKQLFYPFVQDANSISCAEPLLCLISGQCVSLNDPNNNFIGRDQNTQICIGANTYYAQYCKKDYCLFQNQCTNLNSQYIGSEYQTSKCLLKGQITKKKIQQCLDGYCISQTFGKYQCIQLDIDISKNAVGVDINGNCLGINQSVAVKCFKDMSCTSITQMGQVCVNVDPSGQYKCSNPDGSCSLDPNNCGSCSFSQCLNLTNLIAQTGICTPIGSYCQDSQGDDRCLTFKERDSSNQQQINSIFQLNLIYIVEDLCQGQICLSNMKNKCPIGCYSLFNVLNAIICIIIQLLIHIPIGFLKEQFRQVKSVLIVILNRGFVPIQLCTQSNCQSCITKFNNGLDIQVCQKCVLGFYLDLQYQCQKCNSTCLQCELGTLDIYGKKIYYYELSIDLRLTLDSTQLYPLCQICKNNSIISYDLISCDQCGTGCASCQYTNGYNYYNIGQQSNVQLNQNEYQALKIFKQCLSCINPQLTIQTNGSDCGQSILNCQLHTLINKQTSQFDLIYNFAYYQNGSTSNSALICAYCQDNYILSPNQQICSKNGNILDNRCLKFLPDNKSCQLCQIFALDQKNKVCDSNIKCIQAVSGCNKCYYQNLQNNSNVIQLFTCVECQQANYMTTLLGCVKCLDGCAQCYEIGYDDQQRKFNITANIIFGSITYDVKVPAKFVLIYAKHVTSLAIFLIIHILSTKQNAIHAKLLHSQAQPVKAFQQIFKTMKQGMIKKDLGALYAKQEINLAILRRLQLYMRYAKILKTILEEELMMIH
ncbi:hypothetical protein TTHERM_01008760 (macronuclear) [Tetrahymena thermophila SB210]|uniref:Transmembrane protein n=1 Tax=Tetrahymena thermophila (strain SB210) TaxID=312017 RepID=Q24F98_TETTS|nr:hypothetical protein TTHERM_01008760 [Tetrahymena thermophila SB210]EAS06464.2 hypothetical protein TTHERM_01008760 [Tetrahymena thermophila SB210]|eukprot:XP_001026709.2 hypothetical protein TTHERM_01008760 [Tetrahymena thermophila SB210]